ncbi:LytR/AlgR family response regulator transcription factor [Amycolatopsis sp. NPDC059657]|uniref:LytR/AlgR family response regulator transcription factor n=1 Tax=Amycolatopsis sp. NPDC059657 TaxID=3346899 RepID=UPI00366C7ECF
MTVANGPQLCSTCERRGIRPPYQPTLRVLAVDDELPVLEELVYLLRADPRIAWAEGVSDATEALRVLHQAIGSGQPLDALFLDIRMPGLNGLDTARVLSRFAEPPAIVFVTAYDDSAVEAFELNAVDYLLKPVRQERFAEAVHRVLHAVAERGDHVEPAAPEPQTESEDDTIPVEVGGLTRFVKLGDVRFAEADGDYARLHTAQGSFLVRSALTALEERWRDLGFLRIHRSHLVALKYVDELHVNAGRVTVRVGGTLLTVSRRHAKQLRDVLVRQARVNTRNG